MKLIHGWETLFNSGFHNGWKVCWPIEHNEDREIYPTKSRINECLVVTHSSDCTAKRPARVNPWCLKAPGLSSSQRKLCLRVPGLQTAIKKGIEKGLQECEREFQWNRWNCSLLDRKNLLQRAPGGQ